MHELLASAYLSFQNAIKTLKKSLISLGPALQGRGPVATQEKPKKTTVAKLTNDLASLGRVSASSLSSFLDECRAQRERLLQLWQVCTLLMRCRSTVFIILFQDRVRA
jgi:hypothetical protein